MTSRQHHVSFSDDDGPSMEGIEVVYIDDVENNNSYDVPDVPQSHANTSKMKQNHWPFIINLGNSIIGVSVLAMPFCFKQCGIILGALLLLGSAWLTNVSCNLLMKAAIASKRRSYEFLAFQTFGAAGKLAVEVCIIGLLIGTCIAFYVVIGDLGPLILSKLFQVENNQTLRVSILIVLAVTVVTPLGMLRSIESLSNISAISIAFYLVFVVLIFFTSLPNIIEGAWLEKIVLWRTEGIFQSLPIFSMAFGCQTQLFVMYDALQEPSLKQMSVIIKGAISLCTSVYLMVGFFGYIAFYHMDIPGNILKNLKTSLITEIVKFGFVLSVAVSFPLCIFPCRAAIHTLLYGHEQKSSYHDNIGGNRIPESRFRMISLGIIFSTFVVGVIVPNVEFVLGMTGATMGSMICYLFPAIMFIRVMSLSSNSKTVAQIVLVLGMIILFASTYTTLYSNDRTKHAQAPGALDPLHKPDIPLDKRIDKPIPDSPIEGGKDVKAVEKKDPVKDPPKVDVPVAGGEEKRREPPIPHAPDESADKKPDNESQKKETVVKPTVKEQKPNTVEVKKDTISKGVEKEGEKDKVTTQSVAKKQEAVVEKNLKKQDEILHQLAKQQQEQKKLIAEHKQLIQELKEHKKEHDKEDAVNQGQGVKSANADILKELNFKAIPKQQVQAQVKTQASNLVQSNQNLIKPVVPQQNVLGAQPKVQQPVGQQNVGQNAQVQNALKQPVQQPIQNVAQKPVINQNMNQQPVQNVARQPVQSNLVQQPVQNAIQQPVQNRPQQPLQNIPQQPVPNIAQQPVQNAGQQPVQNVNQQPIRNVVQQPVQNVAQKPVINQNMNQQPVQNVVQQPVRNVAQQPVQNVAQQPVQNVVQQPVRNVVQQPVQNVAKQPVQNVAQQPVQNVAKQPVQNVVQQPVQNVAQQPVQNVAKQPVQNVVQQPVQNVAKQPVQNIAQQPVQNVAQQPVQNVAQQPVQNNVQPPVKQNPIVQPVDSAGKKIDIKQSKNVNALPNAAGVPALNKVVPNDPHAAQDAAKDLK